MTESGHRFLRPIEAGRTRRNHRQLQAQRFLAIVANVALVSGLLAGGFWIYRQTQEDVRFAVRSIEIDGVRHSPRTDVDRIAEKYRGANLFRLEIESVRSEFAKLPWIQRVAVEKRLPDTLVVRLFERVPAALVNRGGTFHYVDATGVVFAELSPKVGNAELPIIASGNPQEIAACVELLASISRNDQPLYSRVSEIESLDDGGFRIYDRALRSFVILGESGDTTKWRMLHALAAAEGLGPGELEYADLRFRERMVLKPRDPSRLQPPVAAAPGVLVPAASVAAISASRD
jgi:cell division protein FtsQ